MSDLFNRIIVPLLYGPDSTSVWRVDRSKISSSPLSRSSLPTDKSLTYGEVLPSSVERHVLPLLALRDGDVVVDLGSGTGKIPLQIALAARALGLNGVSCRGVELARERHDAARRAYAKLSCISPADVEDLLGDEIASNRSSSTLDMPTPPLSGDCHQLSGLAQRSAAPSERSAAHPLSLAAVIASTLHDIALSVSAVEGDFLRAPLADATVVFVNNTVFDAQLMNSLADVLAALPRLRTLVLLRPLCSSRHGARCLAQSRACCRFSHPPLQGVCHPTWCASTTLFAYQRVDDAGSLRLADSCKKSLGFAKSPSATESFSPSAGTAAETSFLAGKRPATLTTPPKNRAPKRPRDIIDPTFAGVFTSAKKRVAVEERGEKEV